MVTVLLNEIVFQISVYECKNSLGMGNEPIHKLFPTVKSVKQHPSTVTSGEKI